MKLGIDFGTTNTAISHMDGDSPKPLTFGSVQENNLYIPSLVALELKRNNALAYGSAAKRLIGKKETLIYRNFKMLLGESSSTVAQHWPANAKHDPDQVAGLFISHLIDRLKEEKKLQPTGVVVTVPVVWLRDQNAQPKREQIIRLIKKLGIREVKVESEPEAAASYFLFKYKQVKKQQFEGHLLVCDCGGGTMDFCLLKVEDRTGSKSSILVLERAGSGAVNGQLGGAGVAFDEGVVNELHPELKAANEEKYCKTVRDFEQNKINLEDVLARELSVYLKNPDVILDDIFDVGDKGVSAELLVTVFDRQIRPGIEKALEEVKSEFKEHGVKSDDPEAFRILMVGGFSSFYLVKKAIGEAFGSVTDVDERTRDIFTSSEQVFAIANGAALIANDFTEVVHTCHANVGLFVTDYIDGKYQKVSWECLKKGTRISEYQNQTWLARPGTDKPVPLEYLAIEEFPVYVEASRGNPYPISIPAQTFVSMLPPGISGGGRVNIGFSIDEDSVLSIHIRDAQNIVNVKSATLGSVQKLLPTGLIVVPEERINATRTIDVRNGIDGMRFLFNRGYAAKQIGTCEVLIDNMGGDLAFPYVFLHQKVLGMKEYRALRHLLEQVAAEQRSLLVVAEAFVDDALEEMEEINTAGTFKISAVSAPGFGDRRSAMLQDLAILTGGCVISSELGLPVETATIKSLGQARLVRTSRYDTTIIGGSGSLEEIDTRIGQIKGEIARTRSDYDREKLQERLRDLFSWRNAPTRDLT